MKILNLKLTNYKRIALTGYENIELDFTNRKLQLILGDNGSGKSSVIRECSPFPIKSNDVGLEGGKEVLIMHHNEVYKLSNYRGKECSFIRMSDGEELNPGGTIPVQKELIKNIFNYTTDIHSLLTGDELFTEMKPNRRKEWITRLSDVSYDYALAVYANLKERYRDTSGAVKVAKKKLVEATENKPTEELEEKTKQEIRSLEEEIENLNQFRTILEKPDLGQLNSFSLDELYMRLLSMGEKLKGMTLGQHDILKGDYEAELNYQKGVLNLLREQKNNQSVSLLEKQEKLQEIRSLGVTNSQEIDFKSSTLVNEILSLKKNLRLPIELIHPELCLSAFEENFLSLSELFSDFPINDQDYYSRNRIEEIEKELAQKTYRLNQITVLRDTDLKEREHLNSHRDESSITCPKCAHQFNPNFSEERLKLLSERLIQYGQKIENLNHLIKEKEKELEEVKDYQNKYSTFLNIVRSTKILNPFWSYLSDLKIVRYSPSTVSLELNKLKHDINVLLECKRKEEELSELQKVKKLVSDNDAMTLTRFEEQIKEEEEALSLLIEKEQTLMQIIKDIENKLAFKNQVFLLKEKVKFLLDSIEKLSDYEIRKSFQDSLLESIRLLQISLGEKVKVLNDINNRKEILKNMEDQLIHLQEEELVYKTLMDTLSPTDGLIAKGLLGFIKHIINLMNELIGRVWSYPMSITPPKLDENNGLELDYKFPFEVLNENNKIPDVGNGSKGQREIIDLAFRIIACQYLRLSEIPIWADEFGTGLDEAHRKRASDAIKTIINEENYAQLFMISHYSDAYGSLVNADICVLSGNNITIPKDHNEHVHLY